MVLEILTLILVWRQARLEREKLRLEAELLRLQTARLQQANEASPLIVRATQADIERYGMGTQRLHDQVHPLTNDRMLEHEKSPRIPAWCRLVAGLGERLTGWKLRPMTGMLPAG